VIGFHQRERADAVRDYLGVLGAEALRAHYKRGKRICAQHPHCGQSRLAAITTHQLVGQPESVVLTGQSADDAAG
jgi:hypothetical protein